MGSASEEHLLAASCDELVKLIALVRPDGGDDFAYTRAGIDALAELRRSIDLALHDWRGHLANLVREAGGSIDLGSASLVAKKKYRDRYDHGRIVAAAVRAAITDEDGELTVDDPRVAAERTAALMMELYVAPASEPKKEPLQRLHFEGKRGALASHEHIGWEVEVRAK